MDLTRYSSIAYETDDWSLISSIDLELSVDFGASLSAFQATILQTDS